MRAVLSSSPPGAPRSIVTALSMPRPAYIAAHSPAGPAPTMITSYPLVTLSRIRAEFQSRGIPLSRQGARELRAKPLDLELDVRSERARQLLQRRPPDGCDPVPVAALQMQQRRRGLDQPLPDACHVVVAVPNNRTPDSFQGFVSEPVFPGVEQVTGTGQDGLTLCRRQGRHRLSAISRRRRPTTDSAQPQQIQRPMTTRDRTHED